MDGCLVREERWQVAFNLGHFKHKVISQIFDLQYWPHMRKKINQKQIREDES